jgi:hypothetical protein
MRTMIRCEGRAEERIAQHSRLLKGKKAFAFFLNDSEMKRLSFIRFPSLSPYAISFSVTIYLFNYLFLPVLFFRK